MTRLVCLFFLTLALTLSLAAPPAHAVPQLSTLYDFTASPNPTDSQAGLIQGSDGNFYGTTYYGGTRNDGTIFMITLSGTLTTLVSFDSANGANPSAGLVQGSDGNFYGTTDGGGSAGGGTVFQVTSSGALTTVHDFGDGSTLNDGSEPVSALVLGSDGNFYGTTEVGGASGYGAVFKMTPAGTVTTLHSFSTVPSGGNTNSDGAFPYAGLIQGTDGNFYGTTVEGGSSGGGTIFNISPAGSLTTLHNFDVPANDGTSSNGSEPIANLVEGSDGNFYGMTPIGGANADGALFKVTPTGTLTTLVNFNAANGANPYAGLIQGSDGNFYGTTEYGGLSSNGTVFQVTPAGVLTILYSFTAPSSNAPYTNTNGANPGIALVQGSDSNLYGTTIFGGASGVGTLFQLDVPIVPVTITSLVPNAAQAGGPAFTLTIDGTNFTDSTTVTFGAISVSVTASSATQLTMTVPAGAISTAGEVSVTVSTPGSATATFTVTQPWNARDIAAVADGTARILWSRADGAAGIWVMNASNAQAAVGPTYGPYTGWTAQDIAAAADGTSRILWNRSDGAAGIWVMNASGVETTIGPTLGPVLGWKAMDIAAATNGASRILWTRNDGAAGIWTLNASGTEIQIGAAYGPYSGWTATAVGASGDGTARILWTRSDGAMGIWTMDANDLQLSVGSVYGPYSDSNGHWTATDLSTSADGTSQVLWKRSDGAVGVWSFSASNVQTLVGPVYGPYAGWTAAALDAANDKARMLWVRSDRAAGVWSFGTNDAENLIGSVYGPY